MSARFSRSIVWLRRDLRIDDNAAVEAAAAQSDEILLAFVLDPQLLRGPRVGAPIVQFFFSALTGLRDDLRAHGSELALREGEFARELLALARAAGAQALFFNADYEPAAVTRDRTVTDALRAAGMHVAASLDHVFAGAGEVAQDGGRPYTVYTPYRRRWDLTFDGGRARPPIPSRGHALRKLAKAEAIGATLAVPAPEAYGHRSSSRFPTGDERGAKAVLRNFVWDKIARYAGDRNAPALDATSHLSPHLRAGTIGIRTCVAAAARAHDEARGHAALGAQAWLGELVWRDFYQQLLAHHPRIEREPFLPEAAAIPYRDDETAFEAWASGATGYPIVDAAIAQIRQYGWMHNRLRMIVASFLTKDLLLDYRLGERFFEQHLCDADLAQNNGGWQWASSTGTDAAPYFRVFNPVLQSKRFDPDGTFIRAMLPALARVPDAYLHEPWTMPPLVAIEANCVIGRDYPAPVVDHRSARDRAIAVYATALAGARYAGR